MVAKLLTSKAAEGRHSSHRSIKMNFGVITARNQDTPRKLAGNWGENNYLAEITITLKKQYIPRGSQANMALTEEKSSHDSSPSNPEMDKLSKEEIEKIRSLLTSIDKLVASCSLAHSGKYLIAQTLSASQNCNHKTWIIDSDAIDHMINSSQHFTSYITCPRNNKIKVANDTLASAKAQFPHFMVHIYLTSEFFCMFPNHMWTFCLYKDY